MRSPQRPALAEALATATQGRRDAYAMHWPPIAVETGRIRTNAHIIYLDRDPTRRAG